LFLVLTQRITTVSLLQYPIPQSQRAQTHTLQLSRLLELAFKKLK